MKPRLESILWGRFGKQQAGRTDVQGVVISAQAVHDRLLGCGLILEHPVWFTVFWDGFGLRWACDYLGELFSRSFRTQIEARALLYTL